MTLLKLGQEVYVVHLMYVLKGRLVKHHRIKEWHLSVQYAHPNRLILPKKCIGEFGKHIFLSLDTAAKVRDNSMYRGEEIPLSCEKCGGIISDCFDCTVCEYPSEGCIVDTLC